MSLFSSVRRPAAVAGVLLWSSLATAGSPAEESFEEKLRKAAESQVERNRMEPRSPSVPPLTARTAQPEQAAPSNPFLGRRASDFPTVRGPSSIPSTAGNLVRMPSTVGHFNDLFDKLYVANVIARDREAARDAESRRLAAGQFEKRNVYEYDFRSGRQRPASAVILTDPREDSWLPAGFRRSEATPSVTVGRLPSGLVRDKFAEQRFDRDVALMEQMTARQAELDNQRLRYDSVRSLLTPPGSNAVSTVRPMSPASVVNFKPVSSKPTAMSAPVPAWHPPMALPKTPAHSTPLP